MRSCDTLQVDGSEAFASKAGWGGPQAHEARHKKDKKVY